MTGTTRPLIFACEGHPLLGVLHAGDRKTGVLMVNGGVQTRVGPHRIFVDLARGWAADGHPVLRFDRRGIGDSGGRDPGFLGSMPDVEAAVAALLCGAGVDRYIGFGLCDGATALALACAGDPRCAGLILLNPWIVEATDDPARLTAAQHYQRRLRDPRTLRRLLRGEVRIGRAMRSLGRLALDKVRRRRTVRPLSGQLAEALIRFSGPRLILLSEHDTTAAVFEAALHTPEWAPLLQSGNVTLQRLAGADHTCSPSPARAALIETCRRWVATDAGPDAPA